jgi:hypothetical protein
MSDQPTPKYRLLRAVTSTLSECRTAENGRGHMCIVGYGATILAAIVAAGAIVLTASSVSDIRRYLRIRSM